MKMFIILQQVSCCMTLILSTVFAGKTCSAVSPLPEDFYANFGGDLIPDDSPHDEIMRQVLYRNGALCSKYPTELPNDPRV